MQCKGATFFIFKCCHIANWIHSCCKDRHSVFIIRPVYNFNVDITEEVSECSLVTHREIGQDAFFQGTSEFTLSTREDPECLTILVVRCGGAGCNGCIQAVRKSISNLTIPYPFWDKGALHAPFDKVSKFLMSRNDRKYKYVFPCSKVSTTG